MINCNFWFQRAPFELSLLIFPSLRLWLTPPPHLLHVSDNKLGIFTSSRDTFTVGGREKASLPPKLIFPSNILQEELLEVECAQVGRLSNWLWWGYVRHTQTSLMPRAVICQHELWSKIFLIHFWGWGQCGLLYLFLLLFCLLFSCKDSPKTVQNPSYFFDMLYFSAIFLFLPLQALVMHVKLFSVTEVEFLADKRHQLSCRALTND